MMISRSKHRPSVEVCADCGASDPSWASINRGLLLCSECCSVHRSMGRHISHVKSLRQGSWPPSLLAMVHASTAQNVNCIWEHSLLDTSAPKHLRKKPQPKDPLHPVKSEFILAKHLRLAYVLKARRDEPPGELGRQLHSAVRSSSLDTAMRLLAQGADPNYYNQEKGSSCLHVSSRAGQAAQCELLAAWGADPTALDHSHLTPSDCARQGGHPELADRLSELVYEASDKLILFLTGSRPSAAARRGLSPAVAPLYRAHDNHEMTDVAKAARGKLQLLPNHLFEELVMDIYDEIDRRETEAVWQTSACGLERCGVAFLPVNPALSAPRNQGRQKLARLSAREMALLVRDVIVDGTRRQRIATLQLRALTGPVSPLLAAPPPGPPSHLSDDEPLYDSVADDDDYAALAPLDIASLVSRGESAVNTITPPQLAEDKRASPKLPQTAQQIECLKKELDSRDSTISELKDQLKSLQTIVEQLTKENSVLKSDDMSVTSLSDNLSNVLDPGSESVTEKERGRSLETDTLGEVEVRQKTRPVSMFEAREGPKNNWQVTKHQLTTVSSLDRSLTQSVLEGADADGDGDGDLTPVTAEVMPSYETVQLCAEGVTRAIQELWTAARDQRPRLAERGELIRHAVSKLRAVFPQRCSDAEVSATLTSLVSSCGALSAACRAPSALPDVRAAAYDLAKDTKALVTIFTRYS